MSTSPQKEWGNSSTTCGAARWRGQGGAGGRVDRDGRMAGAAWRRRVGCRGCCGLGRQRHHISAAPLLQGRYRPTAVRARAPCPVRARHQVQSGRAHPPVRRRPPLQSARTPPLPVRTLTLFKSPNPSRSIAACLPGGSGGLNAGTPRFSAPSGAVTTAASAATRPAVSVCTTTPSRSAYSTSVACGGRVEGGRQRGREGAGNREDGGVCACSRACVRACGLREGARRVREQGQQGGLNPQEGIPALAA